MIVNGYGVLLRVIKIFEIVAMVTYTEDPKYYGIAHVKKKIYGM